MQRATTQPTKEPPFDRVANAMKDEFRREILFRLYDPEGGHGIEAEVTAEELEQNIIALHHTHLPILEDMGYVKFDRDDGMIRPGPKWGEIQPFIRLLSNHADELPSDYF